MTRIEYRAETCNECGWSRDRQWSIQTVHKGASVPRGGYRVEKRTGEWRRVAAPTRMVTLCGCDT
jgi:hypothetical protein